jgi:hypothetical protein
MEASRYPQLTVPHVVEVVFFRGRGGRAPSSRGGVESASRPLVGFGVLNDNLIKCLISFVKLHEQILSNRYKGIHGYITQSTIMM